MIGLKLRRKYLDLIKEYNNLFDFYEVYIDRDFPVEELKKFKNVKITIHTAHSLDGFESSRKEDWDLSRELLKKAIRAADMVGSEFIIVHCGREFSKESKKNMFKFFDDNFDKRIVFENCAKIDYVHEEDKYLFSLTGEMKELLNRYDAGMILDFGHAICTANVLGLDYNKVIDDFLKLKPRYFHVSGIELNAVRDDHFNLFEVKNNFDYLKKIPKDSFIVLENNFKHLRDREAQLKDLEIVRSKIRDK